MSRVAALWTAAWGGLRAFLALAREMCRNLSRAARVRYAVRMFSLPRRWLLTAWTGASLVGCEAESVVETPVVQPERPRAGKLPEPTPSPESGGEAGDEGGEVGGEVGGVAVAPPEIPEVIEGPPSDYGQIKPPVPVPPPEALTVHAMAGYEVVTVYSQPDLASPKLGYMRIGTRTMVGERIDHESCKHGFYALPAGGFGCASKGLVVDREREVPSKYPPPAPRLDNPLPYDYGFVRNWNAPMWWRLPT